MPKIPRISGETAIKAFCQAGFYNEMLTDNSAPSVVYESVSKMYADRKNAELAARDGQGG